MVEIVVLKIEVKSGHYQILTSRFRECDDPLTICLCAFIQLSVDVLSLLLPYGRWIYTLLPLYL